MLKKKRIVIGSIVVILLTLLSVSLTLAFLTDSRKANNQLEFAKAEVRVVGSDWGDNASKVITPGSVTKRNPSVENIGSTDVYVRAVVTVSEPDLKAGYNVLDFVKLGALGSGWQVASTETGTWGQSNSITVVYNGKLAPNQTTSAIFENFTVEAINGNDYFLEGGSKGFDILVKAEAVQANVEGMTITSAEDAFAKLIDNNTP